MSAAANKEQLKQLEQLQEIDSQAFALEQQKGNLPAELANLQKQLGALDVQVTEKQTELDGLEKTLTQSRSALQMNQERMDRANTKVDSVANNQEYQAASKEAEQLKKLRVQLEEQVKLSEDRVAKYKEEVDALVAKRDENKTDIEKRTAEVQEKLGGLDTQVSELNGKRKEFTEKVDRSLLSRYDRIRKARGGLGLAAVADGRCTGCNIQVPPQMANETRSGTELHQCPTCQRILFHPGA